GVREDHHVRPGHVAGAVPETAGIVVAARVADADAPLPQPGELLGQKPLGGEGDPVLVEQVARDEERVGARAQRQVYRPPKSFPGRFPQPAADIVPPGGEGRVQMDVGDVNEPKGAHGATPPCPGRQRLQVVPPIPYRNRIILAAGSLRGAARTTRPGPPTPRSAGTAGPGGNRGPPVPGPAGPPRRGPGPRARRRGPVPRPGARGGRRRPRPRPGPRGPGVPPTPGGPRPPPDPR